jgi:hypothetical protein
MRLPPKSYFHLTEVAERWQASMADLACYAFDGLLEISVMAIGTRVEVGWFEATDNGVHRFPEDEKVLHGPQPVIASDLWPVLRGGRTQITRFKPSSPNGYCVLAQDGHPIAITLGDLLVTRPERDRFEAKHGLAEAFDQKAPDAQIEPAFLERNNYAEVVLNGELFRLGFLQAAVVRELHQASQTDNPWRLGKTLLQNAKSQTFRMVDLFKTKSNWRTLIASDGRGFYRLNLPNQAVPRPSHRAYRRTSYAIAS